jgi:hypothetical protein
MASAKRILFVDDEQHRLLTADRDPRAATASAVRKDEVA